MSIDASCKRAVDGILLLDKPIGPSSNKVLQKIKRQFQAAKAGHTGSLDPLASGMLPICLGQATKVSGCLLDADKCYRVNAVLGVRTDTADREGKVIQCRPVDVPLSTLQAAMVAMSGDSLQHPPMYSALKHHGQPLYKLARAGQVVERKPRPISVYRFELTAYRENSAFDCVVECSKGTYIRSLIDDLGERLGCGAHVSALHRDWVGPFKTQSMVNFAQLEARLRDGLAAADALLLPADSALAESAKVCLGAAQVVKLRHGQELSLPDAAAAKIVRVYGENQEFIGLGEIHPGGRLVPTRLFSSAKT